MLETLRNLSGKAKAGIIGGVVLLAAAGIGVGVWQPWNQPEDLPDEPDDQRQEELREPEKKPDKGLSLQVSGEKVPCVLYEGDGWSIYVPEAWTTEKLGENGGLFASPDGAQLSVRFEPESVYTGSFVNLSAAGDGKLLQFYSGSGQGSPVVEGSASQAKWDQYDRLFVAMARTLTVGDETPFAENYVIPVEPDWETAEGMTVLYLDKDGYIVDGQVQAEIERNMESWPVEDREVYTGQYRINSLAWAGSYTGLAKDGFVDVFRADVQYRVAEGANPEGAAVANGWASRGDGIYLALTHDGGTVSRTQGSASGLEKGWAGLAAELSGS